MQNSDDFGKNDYLDYDFEARKKRRNGKPLDKKIAREDLLLLKSVFDKHNIRFWLLWGTLLGAIRENDFIDHDSDIDIGMFYEDKERLLSSIPDLEKSGLRLIRRKYPDDLFTFMKNDEYIDIGLFEQHRDLLFRKYWNYQDNRIYGNHFEKFEQLDFLHERFYIPLNSQKLLKRWYGETWRTPKKDCPANAEPPLKTITRKLKILLILTKDMVKRIRL